MISAHRQRKKISAVLCDGRGSEISRTHRPIRIRYC